MVALRLMLALITLLGGTLTASALDPGKTINQYGQDVWLRQNGLPANSVDVSLQTRDGYLWLGTAGGLFRFDGVRFVRVSTDANDQNRRESIVALMESADGTLWISTAFSGMRSLKNGKLHSYVDADDFHEANIVALYQSRAGAIWIGSSNGLFKLDQGKFVKVATLPKYVTAITEDARGRIWVGTHLGVRIIDGDQEQQSLRLPAPLGSPGNLISALFTDRQGSVWIGTPVALTRWKEGVLTNYSTQTLVGR
jgi:ligand-binding sensor domain-containing protein